MNTFSRNDTILNYAWYLSQKLRKPNTLGEDDRVVQFWAALDTDYGDQGLFQFPSTAHANLLRQWAELAYWFPALTGPLGRTDQTPADPIPTRRIQNVDLSTCGESPNPLTQHSYLMRKDFSDVWQAFRQIGDALR